MTTEFNVAVDNRGFRWRCVGAVLEDGSVRLVEVHFVREGRGEYRVGVDSLACMRMDGLLVLRIKEAIC